MTLLTLRFAQYADAIPLLSSNTIDASASNSIILLLSKISIQFTSNLAVPYIKLYTLKQPILCMLSNLPSDWDSRRKRVYNRDAYSCQNCGTQGGKHNNVELHAHHIVPKAQGGSHDTSNLITLCKECHNTVHSKSKLAPTARGRSSPDYGKLSDSILNSILEMIEVADNALTLNPNVSVREFNHNLSKSGKKLRSLSLSITETSIQLENINRDRYPDDVVTTTDAAVDAGIKTIEPMLEAIEEISKNLDEAIENELICTGCGSTIEADNQFCAKCGTELEHVQQECDNCGNGLSVKESACPACGNDINTDYSEETQEFLNDIEMRSEKMADAAVEFQTKLEKRTRIIEKYS